MMLFQMSMNVMIPTVVQGQTASTQSGHSNAIVAVGCCMMQTMKAVMVIQVLNTELLSKT